MPQQFFAGVDLGATNVRVAIADQDGEIHARRATPFTGGDPERTLRDIGRTIDELVRGVWGSAQVAAIGMAIPGTVHPDRGLVATAANLPGWGDIDIRAALGTARAIPVAAENDANAAAVGEGWLGAAKGLTHFVFVALGTGIGCGLWLDGRLHRGAHYLAGEAAFFPMTREQVREPGWDNCLETLVGGRTISASATAILGLGGKPSDLFDAANGGDPAATAWLSEFQDYLAMALADFIALLDPQMVVLGGGVVASQGERLLAPVRELVHACTPLKTNIVLSSLGEDAQLLGAVKLARDKVSL